MKTVITALGNPIVNNELKKEKNIQIIGNDIQYQEGIIEILEKNKNINYIILSGILVGKNKIIDLIKKIKNINSNIKLIIILDEENNEQYKELTENGITNIFFNNKVEIKDIIKIIKNDEESETEKLREEINDLKKIILENNQINYNYEINNKKNKNFKKNKYNEKNKKQNKQQDKNNLIYMQDTNNKNSINKNKDNNKNIKIKKIFYKIKNKFLKIIPKKFFMKSKNKKINQTNIISILGPAGVGKSIFTVNLANSYIYSKNKILIIDFDILNNSLHTILGLKKYSKTIREKLKNNNLINNKMQIKELITKINNKIDLISGINLLFDSKYKISSEKVANILEELKKDYDTIIIDTSSECFFDYTKNIIKNSDINIFITEANLLEIKKSKNLLNMYIHQWKIDKNKINILFNKYNKNSININILKNIFNEFNILGKLNFNPNYDLIINKNGINKDKKILQEYISIHNKMQYQNKEKNQEII